MKKGPKTETTQTNTFSQITPQNTPDTQALRDYKAQSDPSRPYRFAHARDDYERGSHDPYGAYTTPAIRDASRQVFSNNLRQEEGQEALQEQFGMNQQEQSRLGTLAALTSPQIVQSGGTGTSQQSGGLGQFILGNAVEGASGAATAMAGGGG
jgi:hypothetical protein